MQLNLAFLELELLPPPTHMASEHVEATTETRRIFDLAGRGARCLGGAMISRR
jgi:hypothetical protein